PSTIRNIQEKLGQATRAEGLHSIWAESILKKKAEPFMVAVEALGIEKAPIQLFQMMSSRPAPKKKIADRELDLPFDMEM
ncbi:MAG TPA: hypothetical protein VIY47_13695, partial [Ignavibacteriaceae bacterium]